MLASGLVGLLLLNTALAQGSFRLHDLARHSADLSDRQQALQLRVDAAGTPHHLARKARTLGLVAAVDPGFLRLPDGKVLGDPQPAVSPLPLPPPAPADTTGTTDSKPDGKRVTATDKPDSKQPDSKNPDNKKPDRKPDRSAHHGGRG